MVIRADARAMGAVTALNTRVAPRWQGTPKNMQHTDTVIDGVHVPGSVRGNIVKVIKADGTSEYRKQSSFRSRTIAARNTEHKRNTAQINERIMAADLAPIGNVE